MAGASSAPIYHIPPREVVAVEHPMIIQNIEKGLGTFGNGKPFGRVLHDDSEGCIPLYLRQNDPMSVPILSQNSNTNNVLLKITVPKRIGKRKRGSQDSYSAITPAPPGSAVNDSNGNDCLCSHSRNDGPALLLSSLRDNADRYQVEAVSEIERTHRFRGLADFHHSTTHGEFSNKFRELILPGEAAKMRQFKLDPSRGWKQNDEFMPPPSLTSQALPFNWGWHQNPHSETNVNEHTGETELVNKQRSSGGSVRMIASDAESVPQSSPFALPDDPGVRDVIAKLKAALDERPIWTRRALGNCIGNEALPTPISKALHHVAYQFKGGPFRDALIKYGVDPRTDKKYRNYQTIYFRLAEDDQSPLKQWKDVRSGIPLSRNVVRTDTLSHIFDGHNLVLDGKTWQLCDITDPLLARLIENANLRKQYEAKSDGYFSNGSLAKIHAIMKTKLSAIQAEVTIQDSDFQAAIDSPDVVDNNLKVSNRISVPVPNIRVANVKAQNAADGEEETAGSWQPAPTRATRRKKKRLAGSQKLGMTQKYVGKKYINRGSKTGPKGADPELADQGQAISNVVPSIERSSAGPNSNSNSNRLDQPNTLNEDYQTTEENADGLLQGSREDMDDDDDGEEDFDDRSEGEQWED